MKKVKTSGNLKARVVTIREVMDRQIPAPTSANISHGHLVYGMRDVNHIEWEPWEQDVDAYLRVLGKRRLDRANRYYNAMNDVQKLLREVSRRSEELQVAYEEMQSINEEMQSTNEELQATTDELERSNAYRQTLTDSMTDILLTTDQSGVITDVNKATELISGYQKDELTGQPLHQFFVEQDRAQAGIEQLRTEGMLSNYDLTVVTKAGREVPVSFNATALRDPDGLITGLLGSARDVTEIKKAQEALQVAYEEMQSTNEEMQSTNEELQATTDELERSSAYRQTLMDSMLDVLMTTDTEGILTEINRATERISGYPADELLGKPFSMFFTESDRAQAGIEQVIQEGTVSDYELTVVTKDGQQVPVSYNATVLRDPEGRITGLLGSARDVSEQKRAEQELQKLVDELKESQAKVVQASKLVQAGKMAAMGTMTAGVAHELNNPLMGILNFIQYCLKHTSDDDKRYTVLQDADREAKRCAEIVQNLLTFSHMEKEGEETYHKESCAAILDRVLKLLSYRIERKKVTVTQHTAKGTPDIWMRVNNIQQVLFNLINNALDAVKESEKKEIHVDMHREGKFVLVTIADSGCGIPPENLRKIFDPFFTTKPVGQATGLGLSICHSLIEAHGGEITCESEPGAETKFKFLLPIGKAKEEKKQND